MNYHWGLHTCQPQTVRKKEILGAGLGDTPPPKKKRRLGDLFDGQTLLSFAQLQQQRFTEI